MLKKIIFLVISTLVLTYISNEIYIKVYKWNDPQNCFKKEYVDTIGYAGECKGKLIVNEEILRELVNEEYDGDKIKEYGFLVKIITNYDDNNIFTGQVTDMSALFLNKEVEYNIEDWNTSNVTNMSSMFEVNEINNPSAYLTITHIGKENKYIKEDFELIITSKLKEDIGNWDVSKVTNMSKMFSGRKFNQPLNNWDVSNVTNMYGMFEFSTLFNQPLNNWDVSNVTNMSGMFKTATAFNQPLNNWDVSNVTNMNHMFYEAKKINQSLNNWNVSSVTNMNHMFYEAEKFNQPLNNWDVSNVKYMPYMFFKAKEFNQPLNNWNVKNVENMYYMFERASVFNQPLNSWKNENLVKEDFKDSGMKNENLPEFKK